MSEQKRTGQGIRWTSERETWMYPFTDKQRAKLCEEQRNASLVNVVSVGFDTFNFCVCALPDDLSWIGCEDQEPVSIRFGVMRPEDYEALEDFRGF